MSTADRPIAVLGAGTLGRRIALMFASRGGVVRVCDQAEPQRSDAAAYIDAQLPAVVDGLPGGAPATIETTADPERAVVDAWLVVESLPERIELKRTIFGQLDRSAPADAVLATNSSSYPSSRNEPEDVDRLFAMVLRTPSGPFRMMDRVGLDVVLDIENNYATERTGLPDSPRELLRRYIGAGRLGVKSGRGFYDDYETPTSG